MRLGAGRVIVLMAHGDYTAKNAAQHPALHRTPRKEEPAPLSLEPIGTLGRMRHPPVNSLPLSHCERTDPTILTPHHAIDVCNERSNVKYTQAGFTCCDVSFAASARLTKAAAALLKTQPHCLCGERFPEEPEDQVFLQQHSLEALSRHITY